MRAGKNGLKLNIRSGAKLQWSLSSLKPPLVNICNVNNIVGLQKAASGRLPTEAQLKQPTQSGNINLQASDRCSSSMMIA